jgi:hypothetical protein
MDKSKLLADRVTGLAAEVDIPGVGVVKIRALSRWEMIQAGKYAEGDDMQQERFILATAMTDPVMGEDDVAAWQKSSLPSEINAVAMAINELSGLGKGAAKSDVPEVRGES